MKFLIASDIHGSEYFCTKLVDAFHREKADKLLLLGDLLYHGPRNDLPDVYAPKKVIDMLNGLRDKIFCVRGNCDCEVDQMVLNFPIMADYGLIEQCGKTIFATHGHRYNLDNPPLLNKGDVLLHGHTHVPAKIVTNTFVYINCGSVSIPKQNSRHSYLTLENGLFLFKDLDGEVFDSYDMKKD